MRKSLRLRETFNFAVKPEFFPGPEAGTRTWTPVPPRRRAGAWESERDRVCEKERLYRGQLECP